MLPGDALDVFDDNDEALADSPYLQEMKPYDSPYEEESDDDYPSKYLQDMSVYPSRHQQEDEYPSRYLQDATPIPSRHSQGANPYPYSEELITSPYLHDASKPYQQEDPYANSGQYEVAAEPPPFQPRLLQVRNRRDPHLLASRETDDTTKVKHISDQLIRLQKYKVALGHRITRRGGMTFDTASIKTHFTRPERDPGKAKVAGSWLVNPWDKTGMKEKYKPITDEWDEKGLIWVYADLPTGPAVMSHVPKLHRFHHSSFVAGGDVRGAGEWIVQGGKLTRINANSGHYQPTIDFLYRSVVAMTEALHDDTMVLLWQVIPGEWVYVPAFEFIRDPGSGRYRAHERNRSE